MNLPSKKRVTQSCVALALAVGIVIAAAGAAPYDKDEPQEVPTVIESQMVESVAVSYSANPDAVEASAAHASEEVEVVPTLDRSKPLYKVYKNGWEVEVSTELQWYIRDMCEKYDFPEKTIYGMILCESTFQADAYNAGCYGLCQINSFWINGANMTHFTDDYSSRDLCDPYDNLLTLAEMMVYCRDTYGLDLSQRADQVKWLYWHNTGQHPTNVTYWAYAEKALGFADELVSLQ